MGGFNQSPPQDQWDGQTDCDIYDIYGTRLYRRTGFVPDPTLPHRSTVGFKLRGYKKGRNSGSPSVCLMCFGNYDLAYFKFKKMREEETLDPEVGRFASVMERSAFDPTAVLDEILANERDIERKKFIQEFNMRHQLNKIAK